MINHVWQSTVFALAAGLLTLGFRGHRAQVRFALWFAASCKFLLPFSLLMALGGNFYWTPARHVAEAAVAHAVMAIAEPMTVFPGAPTAPERTSILLPVLWACGFFAIVALRLRDGLRVRAAVRAALPIELGLPVEVRSAPGLLEPGVVGFLRPILLLPAGIAERLTPRQFEAVLAHELAHVRRRDHLTSAVHMLVEAIFWFHPLVWWIGARMLEEREAACDEAVLSLGSEPRDYAEGILNVCKSYLESPLACVPGVTGADLKRRIRAILANRAIRELSLAKKAGLALGAMFALVTPVIVGTLHTPTLRGQSRPEGTPRFEVASIRPCKESGGGKDGRGIQKGGGGAPPGPNRFDSGCFPVIYMIGQAYVPYAKGYLDRSTRGIGSPVSGGPAWIQSERYRVLAKAEGMPGQGTMRGPMMQALLEERFHLKIHRESREVPVYELTVAHGGPKLHPFQPGSCEPVDYAKPPEPPAPGKAPCVALFQNDKGGAVFDGRGETVSGFARLIGFPLERPIVDKTGIAGRYDFHLEFAVDQSTPVLLSDRPPETEPAEPHPSIFTAIQQLGLKLESARGPREFLVIDSIGRPSGN